MANEDRKRCLQLLKALQESECRPYEEKIHLLVAADADGIYTIFESFGKQQTAIYVGKGIIRERLYQHFHQEKQYIDEHLAAMPEANRKKRIFVCWYLTNESGCLEGHWIKCIEKTWKYHPRFNMMPGNEKCKVVLIFHVLLVCLILIVFFFHSQGVISFSLI